MDDSWHYVSLVCPVCGCERVIRYLDSDICENCHYTLPDSDSTANAVIYNINNSGTGIAYGKIDINSLSPRTVIIDNCELIKLHHKELDIEFEFDAEKIKNINTIEINGYRFVREEK